MQATRSPDRRGVRALGAAAALAALASLAASPSHAGPTLDRIKAAGKITLGYTTDARPFTFKDDAGNPAGWGIALCRKVADAVKAEAGVASLGVEFVGVTRDNRIQAVADGKVDILCDATVPTLANRRLVSYSIPIFAGGTGAVVRASASTRLKDILAGRDPEWHARWRANMDQVLERRVFSVVAGTRAERALNDRLKEMQLDVRIVPADNYAAGVARVLDGRSDVFFGERAILLDTVRRSASASDLLVIERYFNREPLAFALPRGDEDFRLTVDTALSKLFRSSEIATLYTTYFGKPDAGTLTFFQADALPE